MTGLYTRSGLDQMYKGLEDAECLDRSVIYIDIDHMHVANELHGFEVGNELIVRVADILTTPTLPRIRWPRAFPATDSRSCCHELAQRRRGRREEGSGCRLELVIGPSKEVVDVSVSCGRGGAAPHAGRTRPRHRGGGAGMQDRQESRPQPGRTLRLRGRQHDAASPGRHPRRTIAFGAQGRPADPLCQRIAPLQDRSLPGGYELLLRLQETDGTLVAPGPLIDAAQRYQILPSVDRWVVQRALQMLAPHRGMFRTRGLSMSINVSAQSIGDEAFIQQFTRLLKEANLPQGCVSVELTEQAAITNMAKAKEMVSRVKALGCELALDDFGTGANSLTYLKALQVGRVKIDGSFVRDIGSDRNSQATVRAIVELAKGLGIRTVAEYVETEAIAQEMRLLGVDYAQGYGIGKPVPLAELLDDLTRDESQRLHRLFLET